jgi:translation initiation factor 2D
LRQTADALLRKNDERGTNVDNLSRYLDLAFVRGVLVARPIHHHILGRVTLYLRSPDNSGEEASDDVVTNEAKAAHFLKWPYRLTTQCIWIHADPPPSKTMQQQQQTQEAPTVALLAVLSSYCHDSIQLPTVVIRSSVFKFICRGAHLMRAGIVLLSDFPSDNHSNASNSNNIKGNNNNNNNSNKRTPNNRAKANVNNKTHNQVLPKLPIVGIQVEGNPQIIAVGELTEETTSFTIGPTPQGIAVKVWTSYGDDLCKQQFPSSLTGQQTYQAASLDAMTKRAAVNAIGGSLFDDGHYGNKGFLQLRLNQLAFDAVSEEDGNDEQRQQQSNLSSTLFPKTVTTTVEMGKVEQFVANDVHPTGGSTKTPAEESNEDTSNPMADGVDMRNVEDTAPLDLNPNNNDDAAQPPPNDANPHDLILHQAVCQATGMIQSTQLPMTTATFYAKYVIPNRPPGTTIELRQTSYKKFSKYLAVQVERSLLEVGPDNKTKDPAAFLTKINRRHEDIRDICKTAAVASENKTKKLDLVDLFVVPHQWVKLMHLGHDQVEAVHATSEERQGTGLLTKPEARAILDDYIARESLVNPFRPDMIRLDRPLTEVFFHKSDRRDDTPDSDAPPPLHMTRKEVAERWLGKLEQAFALVELPGRHTLRLGEGKPPEVSFEVSRGGAKYITRLRGLEDFGVDPLAFAREVSKRFACAATINLDPKGANCKKGYVELVFQGHLVDELRALLVGDDRLTSHGGAKGSRYGLPRKAIHVTLKKGVPAKKKK